MSEKLFCFFVFDRSVQKTRQSIVNREGSVDMRLYHRNPEAFCLFSFQQLLTGPEHFEWECMCTWGFNNSAGNFWMVIPFLLSPDGIQDVYHEIMKLLIEARLFFFGNRGKHIFGANFGSFVHQG